MKLLVYVENMPYARPAVVMAKKIASVMGGEVDLCHVVAESAYEDDAQEMLNQVCETLEDVAGDTYVLEGNHVKAILDLTEDIHYDALVLPDEAPGVRIYPRTPIGKTMLHRGNLSVLVVKKAHLEVKKILVCTGGQDGALPAIRLAAKLAKGLNASVTLLHVMGVVPMMYAGLGAMEETIEELLQSDTPIAGHLRTGIGILAEYDVPAEISIRRGVILDEVLREGYQGDYDLVMMGASRYNTRLSSWLVDNVSHKVMDNATSPVFVVHSDPDDQAD
jgi:nucleotide-binding universal stress UspA family protein